MSNYDRNVRYGASVDRASARDVDQGLRAYMIGVYNYMMLGLAVTGFVAYGVSVLSVTTTEGGRRMLTPFGQLLYTSPLQWAIVFAPLVFIIFFSSRIDRVSASTARGMFISFAAVVGLSLSTIFVVYTGTSIARAFFITAAAFGGLSLVGYTTNRDLSAMGTFFTMGLIGVIIAGLVNLFVQSTALQFGVSVLTVVIFAGLTAFYTQRIKQMYYEADSAEVAVKKSINGALMLYLAFINMFQAVLSLTGNTNNE